MYPNQLLNSLHVSLEDRVWLDGVFRFGVVASVLDGGCPLVVSEGDVIIRGTS